MKSIKGRYWIIIVYILIAIITYFVTRIIIQEKVNVFNESTKSESRFFDLFETVLYATALIYGTYICILGIFSLISLLLFFIGKFLKRKEMAIGFLLTFLINVAVLIIIFIWIAAQQ